MEASSVELPTVMSTLMRQINVGCQNPETAGEILCRIDAGKERLCGGVVFPRSLKAGVVQAKLNDPMSLLPQCHTTLG